MSYKFNMGQTILSGTLTQVSGTMGLATQGILSASSDISTGVLNIVSMGQNWTNSGRTVADLGTVSAATSVTSTEFVGRIGNSGKAAGTFTAATVDSLTATANLDIGAFDLRAATLTADGLTAARVVFAGADGVLSDDSDMTFATDTLTVTKLGAFEAAGAINFATQAMTNVDVNSGNIDGTIIGAAAVASGSFSMLSASQDLTIDGVVQLNGAIINLRNVGAAALDAADLFLSVDSVSKDLQARTRTNVVSDFAGTVGNSSIAAAAGVLSLDIANTTAAVIASGDTLLFDDSGANRKETIDDFITIGLPLVAEAAMIVADDYILFLDGGASGAGKKESWADLVGLMAGAGLSADAGQLSVQGNAVSSASFGSVLAEGYNYIEDASAAQTLGLPISPSAGDVVHLKLQDLTGAGKITLTSSVAGHKIDGESEVIIESPFGAVSLFYAKASTWLLV